MTPANARIARATAAVLLALLAVGCTVFPPLPDAPKKELLSQLPTAIPQRATGPGTLLVLPPMTKPVYDTTQMAYMIQPFQVDYYAEHEWGATPSQMLQPLLVQTLEGTHAFAAVLTPPYAGGYRYVLRTELLDLIQDFTMQPPTVTVALRVQLSEGATGRIIGSQQVTLHEPMQQKTPYAGVVAANSAVAKALGEVASFVLERTE